MATATVPTVWYRNVEQDTLHEVVKGSPLERRIRKEQREIVDHETGESDFEPAYERVSDAELKKAQGKPEDLPGFPADQEAVKVKKAAEAKAKADQEAALARLVADQATQTPTTPKAD